MVFVFGSRLYGKCDVVPGLGHVATRFGHFDYLPLFPYEGWLVTSQNGNQWHGFRIPMSAKSILMGWVRAALFVAGLAFTIIAIVAISSGPAGGMSDAIGMCVLAAAAWALLAFTMFFKGITRASYARACELGKLAGLSPAAMQRIAEAYGEPPMSYGFEPMPVQAIPVAEEDGAAAAPFSTAQRV